MAKPSIVTDFISILLSLNIVLTSSALAESKTRKNINPNDGIPINPSAPPSLIHKKPDDLTICQRRYIYKGKTVACDSNLNLDGEGLRAVLSETPAALETLDKYQSTRIAAQNTAYIATGFLVLAAATFFIGRSMTNENGTITNEGRRVRNLGTITAIAGMGITIGYGMWTMKSNESNLGRAVQLFNDAHPNNPIELQFSTAMDIF